MEKTPIQVLLVEDNTSDALLLRKSLEKDVLTAFELTTVECLKDAMQAVHKNTFNLILLDLGLPDSQGLETFTEIHAVTPEVPKVVLSGRDDESFALQAVQAGAQDYIAKSLDGFSAVSRAIRYAIERQKSNLSLRASESRYHQVLDSMMEGCQIISHDWRYLYVNDAASRQGRRPARELLGHTMMEIYPGIETSPLFDTLHECVVSGNPMRFENQFTYTDDSQGWFELSVQPVEQGLFILSTDITERKQAEDKLRESEERFQKAFHSSPIGMVITCGADGKYMDVNEAFCRIVGFSREELIGQTTLGLNIVTPEQRHTYMSQIGAAGHIYNSEMTLRHNSGKMLTVLGSMEIVELNHTACVLSTAIDITERRQAEWETRYYTSQLATLNQAAVRLQKLNPPRVLAGEIIELLEAALNYTYSAVLLIDPPSRRLLPFALSEQGMGDEFAALDAKYIESHEIRVGRGITGWVAQTGQKVRSGNVRLDPRYYELRQNINSELCVPLMAGDKVIGVINIESENIEAYTESDESVLETVAAQVSIAIQNAQLFEQVQRQSVELEHRVMERTAELVRANRAKDEFLASMSHELRTPLTGILGLSESLQLKTYGELNEKQSRALRNIEESGRHLLELINDILDLSKIGAGKLELQFAPCSIADVCRASLQLIKGMAHHKTQTVHYSPPTDTMIVHADARRLKQALVNLLSNAVKFTPEGGELGLEVSGDESSRIVKLTVWDKGIGIKAGDLRQLFDPFTQVDSSLAREYSGTGLGLSLVHRLVELHNGSVEVESVFGAGSRFTIVLPWPLPDAAHVSHKARIEAQKDTGPLNHPGRSVPPKVFVVDDAEVVLQLIGDYLEAGQYRVSKARSGFDLISQVVEVRPDVIVLDIQMPGMDGLEVIRLIRAHADPSVAMIPIIAVTALAMSGDRERCLEAGANEYISKPVKLGHLLEILNRLTGDRT